MILFIDTHLNDIVIILYQNGRIIEKKIVQEEKQHSTVIMPTIVEVLKHSIPESIIVVNGPGSFTGVRLGVTIAKTLAYTLNVLIRTITYLECMSVSIKTENKLVAFNDNNGYYIGFFDKNNNIIKPYTYLNNKEFARLKKDNNVLIDIELNYKEIIEFALKKNPVNPHQVNPIYVKKIEVEK